MAPPGVQQAVLEEDTDSDEPPALMDDDDGSEDDDIPLQTVPVRTGNHTARQNGPTAAVAAPQSNGGPRAAPPAGFRPGFLNRGGSSTTPSFVQQVSVDDGDDDEDSSEGPPGLGSASEEDEDGSNAASDADGPPALYDGSDMDNDQDGSDSDSGPPSLTGERDDLPPDLVTGSEGDEEDSDSQDADSQSDYEVEGSANMPGLMPGFLNDAGARRAKGGPGGTSGSSTTAYSSLGVGRREAAGAQPSAGQQQGTSAGASAPFYTMTDSYYNRAGRPQAPQPQPNLYTQQDPQFMQPQQQRPPSAAAARGASAAAGSSSRQGAQRRAEQGWQTNQQQQQKKAKPRPAPQPSAPAAPAEVVVLNEGVAAFTAEQERRRRELFAKREDEEAARLQPIGRCCYNRGLAGEARWCFKDKQRALIMPEEKRYVIKCSAGCVMMWHGHERCWKEFEKGYEQETRDPATGHGINLVQSLKVREKDRAPLVHCVTEGCRGYITLLAWFEGPPGQETTKYYHFQANQAQLSAIKSREAEDKAAAAEARAAAKQQRDAAAMAAWQAKHGKPKQPKQPRAARPRKQRAAAVAEAPAAAAAAAGGGGVAAAAAAVGALDDDELLGFLTEGGSSNAAAAGAAEGTAAAAAEVEADKPKGITIKRVFRPLVVKPLQPAAAAAAAGEEEAPGTPSTQVSGSTSHVTPSLDHSSRPGANKTSEPDSSAAAVAQLGDAAAEAYRDPGYHAGVQEYVAVHSNAAAVAGGKGGKGAKAAKKRGVTLALEVFNETLKLKEPHAAAAEPQLPAHRSHKQQQQHPASEQQQQPPPPPKQRAPRMGEFPSLDTVVHGELDDGLVIETGPDYLHEALNQLKQDFGGAHTGYLLFECVDFYMIRKQGMDPQEAIQELVQAKTGKAPLMSWVFPKQEAVAVLMPDLDSAVAAFVGCQTRVDRWQRKQLRLAFLQDAPEDEILHRVFPDYVPPCIAEQRRLEEEMREARAVEQLGQGGGELSVEDRTALARMVADKTINQEQLMRALDQKMTAAQVQAMVAAEQQAAAAGQVPVVIMTPGRQVPAGVVPVQQQQQQGAFTWQQQQQMQLEHLQQLQQRAALTQQQQTQFARLQAQQQQWQQQQQAAGSLRPQQQAPGQQLTWQQQQQQGEGEGGGWEAYSHEGWGGSGGYGGQQQQQLYEQEVQDDDEEDEDEEGEYEEYEGGDYDQQQQQQQRGRDTGSGSSRAAAAAAGDLRIMSLSPASKKMLNAAAPEFKPSGLPAAKASAAGAAAAGGTSILAAAGSSSAAAAAAPAGGASKAVSVASEAAEQPAAAEAAAPAAAAAGGAVASHALSSDRSSGSSSGGSSSGQPASQAGPAEPAAAAEQPAAAAAPAGAVSDTEGAAAAAAAGTDASSSRPATADSAAAQAADPAAAAAAAAAEPPAAEQAQQQAADAAAARATQQPAEQQPAAAAPAAAVAPAPAAVPAGGLPPSHVFDEVLLIGTTNEYLPVYRTGNAVNLPVASFGGHGTGAGLTSRSGLIAFNNDTSEVEALWHAQRQEGGVIVFEPVAQYRGVPYALLAGVLVQGGALLQCYPGAQGRAITQALWDWAHPPPPAPPAAAAVSTAAGAGVAAGGGGSSSQGALGAASSSSGSTRPASAGPQAAATGAAGSGSRPGSSGGQAAAAGAPAAAAAALAGAASSSGSSSAAPAGRRCLVCGNDVPAWLVLVPCRHMGPCLKCLPPPANMVSKILPGHASYPVCLQAGCNQPVKQLLRMIM